MPKLKPRTIKDKAIVYRKKGYSYNMISEKLGLAKSTLSDWLREIPYTPSLEVRRRINVGPLKSAEKRRNRKIAAIKEAKKQSKKEIGILSDRDLWMLGIGLYLGEGSKLYESIRIINSDPAIMKLGIEWLKKICKAKTENITLAIHIYPDIDPEEAVEYWSNVLNIPRKQFRKTQIDKRKGKSGKKRRKLPYGTVHLTLTSSGNKNLGVKLHRRIIGWIEAVLKQI